ncbi:MAG TPA: hypothetical protein VFY87_03415 [Geminicoccaceae bacterium]|nr:hypothetical protein [Geminicoccaceae bacterium]
MSPSRARDRVLLAEALEGLRAGAARLRAHQADLAALMPLDPGRLATLTHPQLTQIEAMLKKTEQVIDGFRPVFRTMLRLAGEAVAANATQLQVLDRSSRWGWSRPPSGSST